MNIKTGNMLVLLVFALMVFTAWGTTVFVALPPAGNDANGGADWADAVASISQGVAKAVAGGKTTVLVSNGTYLISAPVTISQGIAVRGLDRNNTIVGGGGAVRCFALSHAGAVLDSLTISNGYAGYAAGALLNPGNTMNCNFYVNFSSNDIWGFGGGAIMAAGVSVVSNCEFNANKRQGSFAMGSAVHLKDGACLLDSFACNNTGMGYIASTVFADQNWTGLINNCEINGNVNTDCGAVHLYFCQGRMTDCIVSNNAGRGMYMQGGSNVVSNCVICANQAGASKGGGVWMTAGLLEYSHIDYNYNTNNGAGMFMDGGLGRNLWIVGNTNQTANPAHSGGGVSMNGGRLEFCTIASNAAPGIGGGGISCVGAATISNCWIFDNSARMAGGVRFAAVGLMTHSILSGNQATFSHGGAVYGEAGASVRNCLIYSNRSAMRGGGVYANNFNVESCTIAGNHANDSITGQGGGLASMNANDRIINTIIYGNTAGTSSSNWLNNAAGVTYTNCCTLPAGLPGAGNVYSDPAFKNPDQGDFRLSNNSPCVNAGIIQDWMSGALDMDGRQRLDRFNGKVDIGCYEYLSAGSFIMAR